MKAFKLVVTGMGLLMCVLLVVAICRNENKPATTNSTATQKDMGEFGQERVLLCFPLHVPVVIAF